VAVDETWRDKAACQDEDPELFFPLAEHGPANERQIAEAKSVCARCPVRGSCLMLAVNAGLKGIWGGTTEEERVSALRRRVAKPVAAGETATAGI
jgi:WhiB family redox-sensing transcriptional regulator